MGKHEKGMHEVAEFGKRLQEGPKHQVIDPIHSGLGEQLQKGAKHQITDPLKKGKR